MLLFIHQKIDHHLFWYPSHEQPLTTCLRNNFLENKVNFDPLPLLEPERST